MYQYRISVNGATSRVLGTLPSEQWSQATEITEERGGVATLERRLVCDPGILDLVADTSGYIRLGERVACPWEVFVVVEG